MGSDSFHLSATWMLRTFKSIDMKKIILLTFVCVALMAFGYLGFQEEPEVIEPSPQRTGGDAGKGYDYLVNGDYVRSGLPLQVFRLAYGKSDSLLQRPGANAGIPFGFTAVKAGNGEIVVAPNCLQCHASVFDGKLAIGLGNAQIDFTTTRGISAQNVGMLENMLRNGAPKQYEAAAPFLTVTKAISPYLKAPVPGVNLADHLTALLVAHRDPTTLRWNERPQLELNRDIIPTDTPPWWLLRKKNAMFYNGFGRGDFGRFLMASNLLTVNDTAEAREVDAHMPDMLAYINSLRPPAYPRPVDQKLARKGKAIFEKSCAKCHGSYGEQEFYPNLLIPGSIIQTDSLLYAANYSSPQFINWFNRSWFTTGSHPARLEPARGYVAPPLDGIWMTAPYFHNASVPDLEGVLSSKARPRYWSRDFTNPEYRYDIPGWKYKEEAAPSSGTYNTDLKGYGNSGHYFGDHLGDAERKAVIEYLKTL